MRPGDIVRNRYILREQLGAGGMGVVYLADEPALARTVAIKVLHPRHVQNHEVVAAFREEAVAASRVRHPNSVAIIECDQLPDGTPVIVMQHVPGRALGRLIYEESIPLARAIDLMTQVLSALDTAHHSGVVHADIKSDNFLVHSLAGRDHVTMIDFGLARLDGAAAIAGMVSGTPEYLAPEVIRGEPPTAATDLYGAGVILYELLTGTTPFAGGTTAEILARQLADAVVPPSLRVPDRQLPDAIDDIVLRALAKEPGERYRDAAEMTRVLRAALRTPAARASSETHRVLERLRRALGHALLDGDRGATETGYATLAAELIRRREFASAARELQEGIELLGVRGPTNRLVAALTSLHRGTGTARRLPARSRASSDVTARTNATPARSRARSSDARKS